MTSAISGDMTTFANREKLKQLEFVAIDPYRKLIFSDF